MCFAYLVKLNKKEGNQQLTTYPLVTIFVNITSHNLIINTQSNTTSTYMFTEEETLTQNAKLDNTRPDKLLTTYPLVTTFLYITSHNLIINTQSNTTLTFILIFPKGSSGDTHQKSRKLYSSSLNTSRNICVDFWSQLHEYYSLS